MSRIVCVENVIIVFLFLNRGGPKNDFPVLTVIQGKENQLCITEESLLDSLLQTNNYLVKYSIIGASVFNILCLRICVNIW